MMLGYKRKKIDNKLSKDQLFRSLEDDELLTVTVGGAAYKGTVVTIECANKRASAFNFRFVGKEDKARTFFGHEGFLDLENPSKSWLKIPSID